MPCVNIRGAKERKKVFESETLGQTAREHRRESEVYFINQRLMTAILEEQRLLAHLGKHIDLSCLSSAEMISNCMKILPLMLKTPKQELHIRLCLILLEMFGG